MFVYTIQPVAKLVVKPGLTTVLNEQLFVQPVVKQSCTTGLTTVLNEQPLFVQKLSNGFDNRLNVCIHDTTGCETGFTTVCIM